MNRIILKWISVKDRLPEFNEPVMLFARYEESSHWVMVFGGLTHHRCDKKQQWWYSYEYEPSNWDLKEVTHWYPLLTEQPPDTVGKARMVEKKCWTDYACSPDPLKEVK